MANFDFSKYQEVSAPPSFDFSKYQEVDAPAPPETTRQKVAEFAKDVGNSGINFGLDIASGLARGTGDLINLMTFGRLYDLMGGRPPSFNEILDRPQNNIDKIVEGVSEFAAPGGIVSKGAKLANAGARIIPRFSENMARDVSSGLLSGVSHANATGGSPVGEGLLGAVGAPAAHVAGAAIMAIPSIPSAVNNAVQGAKSAYYGSLLDKVAPNVMQKEFRLLDAPENVMYQSEQTLRGAHGKEYKNYTDLNEKAKDIAVKVDESIPYDSSDYVKKLTELRAKKNPIRDAEEVADIDTLIASAPKNYQEAIEQRVFINSKPHSDATKTAREALISSVDNSVKKAESKEALDFYNTWQKGNQQYAEKVSPFYDVPDNYALLQKNNKLKKSLQSELDAEGNLANLYFPKGAAVDTNKIKHLSELIGEDNARKAARSAYFKDTYKPDENFGQIPTKMFLTKYEGLSPKQQKAMFTDSEIKLLDTISYAMRNKNTAGMQTALEETMLGGIAGDIIGGFLGLPKGASVIAGGFLGKKGGELLAKKNAEKYSSAKGLYDLIEKTKGQKK